MMKTRVVVRMGWREALFDFDDIADAVSFAKAAQEHKNISKDDDDSDKTEIVVSIVFVNETNEVKNDD